MIVVNVVAHVVIMFTVAFEIQQLIGEELLCDYEPTNEWDKYTIVAWNCD